ncbi:MAG TPA: HAMP domain-containing sensor histidine kinase, partial [Myxococcales bacterium]|nr:HAMP domain-containing sensor histidine kinase [Myxococcales bacterium]
PDEPHREWHWGHHQHGHRHGHGRGFGRGPGDENWAYWWQRYHLWRRSFGPLRRRMFLWFGLTILLTGLVVVVSMAVLSRPRGGWDRQMERLQRFAGGRFAAVWDRPQELGELAQSASQDLNVNLELRGVQGALLASYGGTCNPRGYKMKIPVEREGRRVGEVLVCGLERAWSGGFTWRHFLGIAAAAMVLWGASGKVAKRLARPMDQLAVAARELGDGKLSTRVDLRGNVPEEAVVLAESFNDMAARIERQLAEQRELLAAVSHEMRTPLGHMRLLIELARDAGPGEKVLKDLEQEVLEIDALVGQLLASSRLEFAQVSRSPLEATELARKALERAGADPALLAAEQPDLRFEGDPTLLQRALANLLDNARKHGQGIRKLAVRSRDGAVVFEVDDQGRGFAPGEEEHAFDAFKRGPNGVPRATGHDAGSLHLGLSLVRRIAEAHGGKAYAQNLPEGGARVGFEVRKEAPPESA